MNSAPRTLYLEPKVDLNRRYTYDELSEIIGETNRPCELWNGQLLMDDSPTWDNQKTALRFYVYLLNHVESGKLGQVIAAPMDMILSQDSVVQPDVAFLSNESLYKIQGRIRGPADLVAEVVSPQGRHRDWVKKRELYEGYGVKEYWIIDPQVRALEVFGYSSARHYESIGHYLPGETARSRLLEGFEVDVTRLLDGP